MTESMSSSRSMNEGASFQNRLAKSRSSKLIGKPTCWRTFRSRWTCRLLHSSRAASSSVPTPKRWAWRAFKRFH